MQTLLSFMHLLGIKGKGEALTKNAIEVMQDSLQLIVPSQRVREYAIEQGFKRVIDAGGASDDLVLASLRTAQKHLEGM
jgi:hypothetical protein